MSPPRTEIPPFEYQADLVHRGIGTKVCFDATGGVARVLDGEEVRGDDRATLDFTVVSG